MTGKKLIDTILIGLMVLATLATVGVFVYTQILYERPLPNPEAERAKMVEQAKEQLFPNSYKLDKLIINLPSKSSRLRFLDVQAYLVPFTSEATDSFDKKKATIQDIFIEVASAIEPNELGTISGKILLESRLKKRINELFAKPLVKNIQFTDFVIQ
ncbi:MAG: hypothetical protein CME71_06670 [Halobacteriovorax sp.]|nr:hypothetical protein [Halobacteriovorax sp.]